MPYNLQSLPKARTCFQAILTLVCFLQVSLSRGQVTVAGALGGVNGAYTQLRLAFNAINTQLQGGANIVVTITGNTVETGTAQLIQSAAPWNSFTIIPSGGAARTISGNLALPLINLNGADRVKIDGLNAGGNSLTIVNNSTSALASTIQFSTDATLDTLVRLTIQGTSRGAYNLIGDGATIKFGLAGTSTGNDNNYVGFCTIGPVGASLPHIPIKSHTTSFSNDNITITDNLIFDYFATGSQSNGKGILAFTGSSTWTITNNRIYQTGTRTWPSSGSLDGENIYSCIDIQSGSGYTITGNVLGYANSAGTGFTTLTSPLPLAVATNYASMLQPLIVNQTTATPSVISNNQIGGFNLTSSRAKTTTGQNIFLGIYLAGGSANITNNVIGSSTGTGAINILSTSVTSVAVQPTPPVPAVGIYVKSTAAAQSTLTGNTIGGIAFTFSAPGQANCDRISFIGILADAGAGINVNGNTIGNSTAANITSTYTLGNLVGIQNLAGNTVSLFTNNTIQNFQHAGNNVASVQDAAVIGVVERPLTGNNGAEYTGNIISNLSNTNSSGGAVKVYGMIYAPTATVNLTYPKFERNWIYNLSTQSNGTTTVVGGMLISGGININLYNNMISLGSTQTQNAILNGIEQTSGGVTAYFNSVRMTGTASGGASDAIAYNYNVASGSAFTLRNNLLYNDRTGGTGQKFALRMSMGAIPAYDATRGSHNLLYSAGANFAQFGAINYNTLAGWSGACGGGDPATTSKTAQVAFTTATDLHTSDLDVRNCGIAITGVTNDFDNTLRPACIDIGCDETVVVPGTTYTWVGAIDDRWCEPCNWDRESVPGATDNAVIPPSKVRYPVLQTGTGCGNVTINDFTVQFTIPSTQSGQIDLATYTLTVNGDLNFAGTCNCTGASGGGLLTEGLIDIASTTQQQIVDIRAANNSYPGTICKLRINKVQPVAAGNAQEALLKGNLNILYNFDIANGVLLSQNGGTYDADENTGVNFKTINILNDDVNAVTRQSIPTQDTRNGFFEGRLNRKITNVGTKNEYLFPLGFRRKTFSGALGDYFYTPSLISFNSVTNANRYVVGTFLNSNNNFMVDGVWIGTTGHGCGNPFEIDDQGGPTASTCLNKEIDMIGDYYWDFQENNGPNVTGDPAISTGALGAVDYDIQLVGDKVALMALDGLSGSELRVVKRPSVAVPDSTGQGAWITTQGTHSGTDLSVNTGMSMYSVSNLFLQGGRRDGLTSFSGFALTGNGPSPLPVELLEFSARKQGSASVLCEWSTASETNNAYFDVEVSRGNEDGLSFKAIGRVPGRGTTTETNHYQWVDEAPVTGINYYRLRQVDYDGTESYSSPVAVLFNDDASFELVGLAPNPCKEETRALLYVAHPGELKIQLSDVSGRVLTSGTQWLDIGSATIRVSLPAKTAAGVYTLRFDFEGQVRFAKLVVE